MARIPSKTEILDWIAENPGLSAKRDIAKAFGIKGAERIELKRLLKELEAEGTLVVTGASAREVGRLASLNNIELHELTPVNGNLEEAYMALTRDEIEYQTLAPLTA